MPIYWDTMQFVNFSQSRTFGARSLGKCAADMDEMVGCPRSGSQIDGMRIRWLVRAAVAVVCFPEFDEGFQL